MSRGTSRWSSSKSVRSAWKCVVERHLWVPYHPSCFPPQGCRRLGKVLLATAEGNVLCREEKTCSMSSCQKGSGVLCASAAALQCPLHVPQQECPGWGFWDCQAASSPAQHLLKCLLEHILSAYLFQEKKFFWEWGSQLGKAV